MSQYQKFETTSNNSNIIQKGNFSILLAKIKFYLFKIGRYYFKQQLFLIIFITLNLFLTNIGYRSRSQLRKPSYNLEEFFQDKHEDIKLIASIQNQYSDINDTHDKWETMCKMITSKQHYSTLLIKHRLNDDEKNQNFPFIYRNEYLKSIIGQWSKKQTDRMREKIANGEVDSESEDKKSEIAFQQRLKKEDSIKKNKIENPQEFINRYKDFYSIKSINKMKEKIENQKYMNEQISSLSLRKKNSNDHLFMKHSMIDTLSQENDSESSSKYPNIFSLQRSRANSLDKIDRANKSQILLNIQNPIQEVQEDSKNQDIVFDQAKSFSTLQKIKTLRFNKNQKQQFKPFERESKSSFDMFQNMESKESLRTKQNDSHKEIQNFAKLQPIMNQKFINRNQDLAVIKPYRKMTEQSYNSNNNKTTSLYLSYRKQTVPQDQLIYRGQSQNQQNNSLSYLDARLRDVKDIKSKGSKMILPQIFQDHSYTNLNKMSYIKPNRKGSADLNFEKSQTSPKRKIKRKRTKQRNDDINQLSNFYLNNNTLSYKNIPLENIDLNQESINITIDNGQFNKNQGNQLNGKTSQNHDDFINQLNHRLNKEYRSKSVNKRKKLKKQIKDQRTEFQKIYETWKREQN